MKKQFLALAVIGIIAISSAQVLADKYHSTLFQQRRINAC